MQLYTCCIIFIDKFYGMFGLSLIKKKKNSFEIPWNVWRLLIHGKLL